MLKFIGTGSAFNTKLGNNSAYIKKGGTLVLLDCGSTTFSTMQKTRLLEGIDSIAVLITHTHADHIGSLADLILYSYYSMNETKTPKVTIFCSHMDIQRDIFNILKSMGVEKYMYIGVSLLQTGTYFSAKDKFVIAFESVSTTHVPQLKSNGYKIILDGERIYYSGDSNVIPDNVLEEFYRGEIDKIYQDVSSFDFDGNPHLKFSTLCELINQSDRHRVYCMHLDENMDPFEIGRQGFGMAAMEIAIPEIALKEDFTTEEDKLELLTLNVLKSYVGRSLSKLTVHTDRGNSYTYDVSKDPDLSIVIDNNGRPLVKTKELRILQFIENGGYWLLTRIPNQYIIANQVVDITGFTNMVLMEDTLEEPTMDLSKYNNSELLRVAIHTKNREVLEYNAVTDKNIRIYVDDYGKLKVTEHDGKIFHFDAFNKEWKRVTRISPYRKLKETIDVAGFSNIIVLKDILEEDNNEV